MSLLNTLPIDLEKIIKTYKKEFENYEKQYKKIDKILKDKCPYNDVLSVEVRISYQDLKDYLLKKNIIHLKIKIGDMDDMLLDLDLLRDDDTMFDKLIIVDIVYSKISNRLFLKCE